VKEGAASKAAKPVDLAIPMFGYKNHIGIDRTHGLIRTWDASAANAHDGARLPDVVSKDNTGSGIWADTAYRSKKNEAFLAKGIARARIKIGMANLAYNFQRLAWLEGRPAPA